jgi:FGGY-family pentulose kinase
MHYFLGVDVGTSSVRVGLFNQFGELVDTRTQSINVFNFKVDFYEQSSDEIFSAICNCIKQIKEANEANLNPDSIVSIGVDATCSLVVLDDQFKPLSVSPSENNSINVIMWMDHRAKRQADLINSTNHECLKNVGKKISPEMDPPKILWLKQNLYEKCYNKAGYFFSLPDYIVFRLTNQNIRSVCCTTCKWLFFSNENKNEWDITFWNQIGLDDLVVDRNFNKIGSQVEKPFKYIEELKISSETQTLTGLSSNVKVGVSMIDAHAGGIGGLALTLSYLQNKKNISINSDSIQTNDILVIVSGTSSCLMASSKMPKFIDGIWGPYYSAMIPNMWLNEAGQSASGKLIDHIIQTHPAFNILKEKLSKEKNKLIYELLNDILLNLAQDKTLNSLSYLTKNIHIYPDFHGNRYILVKI